MASGAIGSCGVGGGGAIPTPIGADVGTGHIPKPDGGGGGTGQIPLVAGEVGSGIPSHGKGVKGGVGSGIPNHGKGGNGGNGGSGGGGVHGITGADVVGVPTTNTSVEDDATSRVEDEAPWIPKSI